jgi:hypothetical protein
MIRKSHIHPWVSEIPSVVKRCTLGRGGAVESANLILNCHIFPYPSLLLDVDSTMLHQVMLC